MAVVTTSILSNSVQALYQSAYVMAMRNKYVYSQAPLAYTPPQGVIRMGNRGTSVNIPFYHRLLGSTAAISETADVTPVTFADSLVTVTPYQYGQAVQISQKLSLTAFSDVERAAAENVARDAAETRDRLARAQACWGSMKAYGGDATSRITLESSATVKDELAYADWLEAVAFLAGNDAPKLSDAAGVGAIISHQTYADQLEDGVIILVGEYSAGAYPFILNGEIGTHIGGVRVIVSDFAKVYHSAGTSGYGADGGPTTDVIGAAGVAQGATAIVTANAVSSLGVGDYIAIGTVETSTAVADQAQNETVYVTGGTNSTTITIVGGGPNGGLVHAHAAATPVTGHYQVHASLFFSAEALAMVYTNDDGLGPDGKIIPPENTGLLKQFNTMGWTGFWGFGRTAENRLYRHEGVPLRFKIGC